MFKKNIIGYLVIVILTALHMCGSCTNEVKEEPKPIEIDSFAVRDSLKQLYSLRLKEKLNADFILDSVGLRYSIDGKLIINKNVLVEVYNIDDIYEDNNQIHLMIYDYDKYIDLTCTPQQLNALKSIQDGAEFRRSSFFMTFKPNYVKKINLNYVSNNNSDDDPETEDESYIEVDKFGGKFKIKGTLINFNIYQYE
jgi:hypothetical protein